MKKEQSAKRYWKSTLKLLASVLSVWALVSFGFGIFWRTELDKIQLGGYPLGFWFAQQGSILAFIILIFVYAAAMNRLDRKFHVEEH